MRILVVCLLLVVGIPAPRAGAETIRVEMEAFTESHDLGGDPIHRLNCGSASEKIAVEGLDTDGEWIRIRVQVTHDHCFIDSLRSAAPIGEVRTFAVVIEPESGTEPAVGDTVVTVPGRGVG